MMSKFFWLFSTIVDKPRSIPGVATGGTSGTGMLFRIINAILVVFGAAAVLIIAIAGLRYVLSRGNPQEISKAKNTILYALVGLVIAIAAYSILNYVLLRSTARV